jgi:hypothetical protein
MAKSLGLAVSRFARGSENVTSRKQWATLLSEEIAPMGGSEVRLSFFVAWMVICVVVLGVLLAPIILPSATIRRLEPQCEWKARYDKECPMCGMTTSFILICRGKFKQASAANRASIPLFSILVVNEICAILLLRRFYEEGRHYLLQQKRATSTKTIPSDRRREGGTLCRS